MKQYSSFTKIVFALASTAVMISIFAFGQDHKSDKYSFRKEQFSKADDTTSGKRNRNGDDGDFNQVEEHMKKLEVQMKKLEDQLEQIDMRKYQKEIDKAMKNLDREKIADQVEETIKDIDWEKVNREVAQNVRDVRDLRINDVKKQLEQAKLHLQKQKFDIQLNSKKIKEDVERAMENAKLSFENAKKEIKNVKQFTDQLEKDGLIDKSKPYKIEVKEGELYINGKKQSKETSKKYRHYYKKSDFTIDMSADDNFWI